MFVWRFMQRGHEVSGLALVSYYGYLNAGAYPPIASLKNKTVYGNS